MFEPNPRSGQLPSAKLRDAYYLLTNRLHFGAFSCAYVREQKFRQWVCMALPLQELEGILIGYPAWIRTKNNASKGRCVTVTPRGMRICDFRLAIFDSSAIAKIFGAAAR